MDIVLTAPAVRVLGCLMEKELATPEYYPLTMNSLIAACNQKSNREPVVAYDEETVAAAVAELKGAQLAFESSQGRVPRYGEALTSRLKLVDAEAAVLALLLVRGPQTAGELRTRSGRLHGFSTVDEVVGTLEGLAESGLVQRLARRPGQKECRYAHLLAGPVEEETVTTVAAVTGTGALPTLAELGRRQEELEAEVARLREEVAALSAAFTAFKAEFD